MVTESKNYNNNNYHYYYEWIVMSHCPVLFGHAIWQILSVTLVTLRASCGAVYCNRFCLFVCLCVCVRVGVCYHDNSKLRASILTKLGL